MRESTGHDNQHVLEDGSHVAVIGGGPTGSFFSIFALKMAKQSRESIFPIQLSREALTPTIFTRNTAVYISQHLPMKKP
jgi:threonine dehydrogenase-like Zn-dependent dehydrogenase